jgi:hypothetical protein
MDMDTTVRDEPTGMIDARPVRPTSNTTSWDQALKIRDQFAAEVRGTLEREKLAAAVFLSANGIYPPWVKLHAWLPNKSKSHLDTASRERAALEFVINVKPYCEHDVVVSATLTRGKTKISAKEWPDFPTGRVAEWVRYALDRGPKPGNYTPKMDALRTIISSILPFIPAPHRNRVMREYRTRFTAAMALGLGSAALVFVGGQGVADSMHSRDAPVLFLLLILLGIAGLVAAAVMVRFRKQVVSVTPQSDIAPRELGLVDSWHAVVSELGRDFDNAKRRLIGTITDESSQDVICQVESYTHRTTNGYEERERLVVSREQGMVHVHIYQFGHDLFVGWQAFLNWAQWDETKPVTVKIREGQAIEFRELRPSAYIPNQFDLIDLSSLSEFVHRRLERELKVMLKEKDIDQEIDFKIIRGDRDNALDEDRHAGDQKKESSGGGWSYRA